MSTASGGAVAAAPAALDADHKKLVGRARKNFDNKRYKLALKALDQVLRRYPRNGESIALKGYVLFYSTEDEAARKDALESWIKRGVQLEPTNMDAWRWYGIACRALRRYDDSLKALEYCLKKETRPDDRFVVNRDVAALQMHKRLLREHLATRLMGVREQPRYDLSWVGAAAGHHMLAEHAPALRLVDDFANRVTTRSSDESKLEMALYRAQLLAEGGEFATALDHLRSWRPKAGVVPHVVHERIAELELRVGHFDSAEDLFAACVEHETENLDFHRGLQVRFRPASPCRRHRCVLLPRSVGVSCRQPRPPPPRGGRAWDED